MADVLGSEDGSGGAVDSEHLSGSLERDIGDRTGRVEGDAVGLGALAEGDRRVDAETRRVQDVDGARALCRHPHATVGGDGQGPRLGGDGNLRDHPVRGGVDHRDAIVVRVGHQTRSAPCSKATELEPVGGVADSAAWIICTNWIWSERPVDGSKRSTVTTKRPKV